MRKYRTKHFPFGILFVIRYILKHLSFCQPFYFKSFQNANICRYTPRNDKEVEESASISKTIVQRVRIWGTPGTTRNPNFLFWMHNWKWMNLIKMAGLNISLSLNRRQNSSDKKHNLILSLVLFFPFCCCFSLWSVAMASPIPLKTESFRPYTKVECIESDETWQGWRLINYLLIVFFFIPCDCYLAVII